MQQSVNSVWVVRQRPPSKAPQAWQGQAALRAGSSVPDSAGASRSSGTEQVPAWQQARARDSVSQARLEIARAAWLKAAGNTTAFDREYSPPAEPAGPTDWERHLRHQTGQGGVRRTPQRARASQQ